MSKYKIKRNIFDDQTTIIKKFHMTIDWVKEHTTRLPSSKFVVYRRVQRSRAGANVVGAYI